MHMSGITVVAPDPIDFVNRLRQLQGSKGIGLNLQPLVPLMADTPTIWWYPDPNGAEVSIAIPRKAQAVGQRQVVNVSTSETIGGRVHSQTFGAKERIQIEFFGVDGANGEALYRAMIPLVAHLRRGGYCFAAMNTDRGWAAFAKGPAARGDTVIPVQGNLIAGINASGSPATGQVFALGPQPLQWRELHAVVGRTAAPSWAPPSPWPTG